MRAKSVASIEALTDRYALFLFDQYGVLHDGVNAYPGLQGTLRAIKTAGCKVGVITNSGKRAEYNRRRLNAFGFDDSLLDVVMSSGEVAWKELHADGGAALAGVAPGAVRALSIYRGDDGGFQASLPVVGTDDAGQCDIVLITGCEPELHTLDTYRRRLEPAAKRGVPAICTNPDRCMLLGDGRIDFAAGVIAEAYASMGGPVRWIGKPHPVIYAAALKCCNAKPMETLCIGDSVEHDVAGAHRAGCDALLVRTGIHSGASDEQLDALYKDAGERPDWILTPRTVSLV